MKKVLFLFGSLLLAMGLYAQTTTDSTRAETYPWEKQLMEYVTTHTEYPPAATGYRLRGTPQVEFIVEPDGTITNIRLIRKTYYVLDQEALRVVRSIPKLSPATSSNGTATRQKYVLPFRFEPYN